MSEYGNQIIAFIHFSLKHFSEKEFGLRIAIELLIALVVFRLLAKMVFDIIISIVKFFERIGHGKALHLIVRLYEKIAYLTKNPYWQEHANRIKDKYKKNTRKEIAYKKHPFICFLVYLSLLLWLCGFHYWGEEKRESYEVFFLGEIAIVNCEDWMANTLFEIDEKSIKCFYHNKIETDGYKRLSGKTKAFE